jgi:hypothetical protein
MQDCPIQFEARGNGMVAELSGTGKEDEKKTQILPLIHGKPGQVKADNTDLHGSRAPDRVIR